MDEPLSYAALLRQRDLLNENLSQVMKRDGELLMEVRELRGVLSAFLQLPAGGHVLGVDDEPYCIACGDMHNHEPSCAYVAACTAATRGTQHCLVCKADHDILLVGSERFVLCPREYPHKPAALR